jgi:hypothetical protein
VLPERLHDFMSVMIGLTMVTIEDLGGQQWFDRATANDSGEDASKLVC